MIERLRAIEEKYNELQDELMKPETISNVKRTLEITKEQGMIKEPYEAYQEYKTILTDLEEAESLLKDPELGEFAKEEVDRLKVEKEEIKQVVEENVNLKDLYHENKIN